MVAWGIRFETDTVTDPRIMEFLLTYQQGPQHPNWAHPARVDLAHRFHLVL